MVCGTVGQMKAADYVLVPDVAMKNNDSGGKKIGGMLGGLLPGIAGVVAGGVSMKSKTADVVLTLTDVRSTEQVALEQGHYKKTDLGWAGGGAGFFGAFAAAGARRASVRRRIARMRAISRRSEKGLAI